MARRWVKVELKNFNQSYVIIEFLIEAAKTTSKQFRMEHMIGFRPSVLHFETAGRVFRDLRFKGLIKYEIKDKSSGVYTLLSNVRELERSRQIVIDRGYYIDESDAVIISNKFAVPIEQGNLL